MGKENKYVVKDSGKRRLWKTGAQRDCELGKGRYDLVPPCAMKRLAQLYEKGAVKYFDRNWELGIPSHAFFDSAMRHLYKYLDGQRDEDHLAAAVFNVFGLIYNEEMGVPKELLDLPHQEGFNITAGKEKKHAK